MRLLVVLCVVAVTAASAAAASFPKPVRATMKTSSTKPVAGTSWRYTIVVKDFAGRPLAAKVRLQILLGALVVGCWKRTALTECSGARAGTWIAFKGKRTGVIVWPAQGSGAKLTFRAVVVAAGRALTLRAPVTVRLP